MIESDIVLRMWVVYDHPTDYPDFFVARWWFVLRDGNKSRIVANEACLLGATLDKIHQQLPDGLCNLGRSPNDDPTIIEVWV